MPGTDDGSGDPANPLLSRHRAPHCLTETVTLVGLGTISKTAGSSGIGDRRILPLLLPMRRTGELAYQRLHFGTKGLNPGGEPIRLHGLHDCRQARLLTFLY